MTTSSPAIPSEVKGPALGCYPLPSTARKSLFPLFLAVIFFGLATSQSSRACSQSTWPAELARNFKVKVFDRGRPVGGLQIELSVVPKGNQKTRVISVLKTDSQGMAEFKGIRPRLYYVGIKHPAFGSSIIVKVMRHPPHEDSNTVTFQWPGWNPLSTQTIAGTLTGRATNGRGILVDMTSPPVYSAVQGATLTLSKAVSGELVASHHSGDGGQFEFTDIPAGLYMLRIETPISNPVRWIYPKNGYVPIEVGPTSQFHNVDLELDKAICGELGWGRAKEKLQ